ncbi:glycosyltransferase family 2 protein [Candidatus Woesearchaeota archaeon]|nr:glycosyltransferase family 2 protein [Candidatus Woesearchaeota archaeon]
MLQYIIWILAFISLYLAIVWLNFLYLYDPKKRQKLKNYPAVTITIPAFNEERTISKTLRSVLNLSYPKNKIEILVVNDGSTDKTVEIVEVFSKKYKNIKLINQKNKGKAAALNTALKIASGEFFACLDADSTITKRSLALMLPHFSQKKTAAVISGLKVNNAKNTYEKLQRFEYILAILMRKLKASINTLAMTPGVLSIYRTKVLKKVGKFDRKNMTEDFEIAMRLKYFGHDINIEPSSFTYTNVPNTFSSFFRQRVRWFRGFIYNHLKYKEMFFNKKYGILGFFQLPLNILGVFSLLISMGIITFFVISKIAEFIIRVFKVEGYLTNYIIKLPSLKEILLSHNTKIMLPIYIASISGIYLFYLAHKQSKEKIKNPASVLTYFILYPYLVLIHWISAISQEILKLKRKW